MHRRGCWRYTAGAAVLLLPMVTQPAVSSGQLQAGPTLLEVSPRRTSTRLTLRNMSGATVAVQVRVYAWSQPEGKDHLVLTDDVAVSPPILELPAGGEQLVRLVRLGPPASDRDGTYRVVVDELPRRDESNGNHVGLRMRYIIPMFARAADASAPALSCSIAAGGTQLVCDNRGGRPIQLGASALLDGRGASVPLSQGLFGYVLPYSRRVWPLPRHRWQLDRSTLRLDTRLNGQDTAIVVDYYSS